jgi:hypothetical protein
MNKEHLVNKTHAIDNNIICTTMTKECILNARHSDISKVFDINHWHRLRKNRYIVVYMRNYTLILTHVLPIIFRQRTVQYINIFGRV